MENDEIEKLVEKFLNGDTSNIEEHKLYNFFSEADVPVHLIGYKKEFMAYKMLLSEESPKTERPIQKKRNYSIKKIVLAMGVAACLIGFIIIGLNFQEDKTLNVFEGSYISSGNEVITDLKVIQPQLEQDYQYLLEKEREIIELLSRLESIHKNSTISTH